MVGGRPEPVYTKTADDIDWENGKVARLCSCHLSLLRPAYQAHFKDGIHNERLNGTKKETS